MAFGRRYYRRFYRRYYRNKYGSARNLRMTRNFKASAKNMTQGGTFNISVRSPMDVEFTGQTSNYKELKLGEIIKNSSMHANLSNVFDQYKIDKISIKFRFIGNDNNHSTVLTNPAVIFSCVDRSGFATTTPLAQLQTYGSYKETVISGAKDVSPVHYIPISQSGIVDYSTYYDTKKIASFPHIYAGCLFATAVTLHCYFSVEIDAQIRYRGVRLDTRV